MPTLIDGYNLLHATGRLTARAAKWALAGARRSLLLDVRGRQNAGADEVTVVFDAEAAPPGLPGDQEVNGIHVKFAHDRTADDLIEEIIRAEVNPRFLKVVSDDHRIQHAARRRGCQVLGCLDYYEQYLLAQRTPAKPTEPAQPAKPERSTPEEEQEWLDAFAEIDDDPRMRDGY